MVAVEIPEEYGYCVLVAIGSAFMIGWKAYQVGRMRKKFKIFYPTMYSDKNDIFNCYQRAHQNTLENYPQFLVSLLLGGLYSPCLCAAGGATWVVARIVYAFGYYTGDPKKRMWGTFGYAGLLPMIYCAVRFGTGLLGWF